MDLVYAETVIDNNVNGNIAIGMAGLDVRTAGVHCNQGR